MADRRGVLQAGGDGQCRDVGFTVRSDLYVRPANAIRTNDNESGVRRSSRHHSSQLHPRESALRAQSSKVVNPPNRQVLAVLRTYARDARLGAIRDKRGLVRQLAGTRKAFTRFHL